MAKASSYKVIQWGTGNVGSQVIAAICDRANLKLQGLFVYSDGKLGRDVGDIARQSVRGQAEDAELQDRQSISLSSKQ